MILRKKVEAGILLYALLMLAIFSLLLQFYLQGQVAIRKGTAARHVEAQAFLMANLTQEYILKEWEYAAQVEKESDVVISDTTADDDIASSGEVLSELAESNTKSIVASDELLVESGTTAVSSSEDLSDSAETRKSTTPKNIKELSGRFEFQNGSSQYRADTKRFQVTVLMNSGENYTYQFPSIMKSDGE